MALALRPPRSRLLALRVADHVARHGRSERGGDRRGAGPPHVGRAGERQGAPVGEGRMSTLDRLRDLLARDFDLAPERLQPDATLESLEIDSLRMIEILFTVEDEFA